MQVSPVELQAWAEETGNPYPSTPAEKAAVLPYVISWKQEQLADARANRGNNALAAPLMVAGGVGLGLAGLAAFRHYKKQGLSDAAAGQKAKADEVAAQAIRTSAAAAPAPAAAPSNSGPHRAVDAAERFIRSRSDRYGGPRLRGDSDPTAGELETRGGVSIGSKGAREQGQYKARSSEGFHNPALAALDTPEKREVYLAGVADANGTDSDAYLNARDAIAAMESQTGPGVSPLDFLQRTDKAGGETQRLSSRDRYGTTTAEEEAAADGFLAQSRTKSNTSAQAGYRSREEAEQSSGKPENASVFFTDADGSLKPYMGSQQLRYEDSGEVYYTGRRSDGSPIAKSDLVYLPNDDSAFYERSGLKHPVLSFGDIAGNAGDKPDLRYADDEDQGTKGMFEALPASDKRFATGVRNDGVGDNWVFGRVEKDGPLVPLELSGFQSEMEAPGAFAGGRLRRALDDHKARTGQSLSENNVITLASDLARQHGVDAATVLRGAGFASTAPEPERTPRVQAHALGGGNSADHLDRVYRSLGMHAGADAWELEDMVRKGDIRGAANALAPLLPALTASNSRFLRGASQDEKLNIVAEGLTAGLQDLSVALQKYPQMAERFGIGKGAGGFSVDAYIKSYIRDWTTVRSLQLDPSGQPTYQVPADALELMAYEGSRNGRGTIESIEDTIRGSRNGLEAALRMDRLVSAAQSTKEGDPNTNATRFAQTVFSMEDDDMVSTQLAREAAGDVRLSFATRRPDDATKGFYDNNPSEGLIDERIENQGIPGFPNATLAARLKGIDVKSPDATSRTEEIRAAQQWIADNAEKLERDREDLNRGIVLTEQGPRSAGRGLVITSGDRGAFLAGNTEGMNTSYREELVNDQDTTPVDRAQDHEREAILNNQVDRDLDPTGTGLIDAPNPVPLRSEADRTAGEYGSQKLYFKNLGPGSKGAMAAGDAYEPRQALRRYLQERGQDQRVGQLLDQVLPGGGWQPEKGFGFEVGASEPVRGLGPKPAAPQVPSVYKLPGKYEPTRVTRPDGLVDGAVDPYQAWYRPAPSRLPGNESAVREFPLITGGFQHSDSLPAGSDRKEGAIWDKPQVVRQHLPNNVALVPAMKVEGYPDRPDQIAFTTDWAPRPAGRQPLTPEQIFQMVESQPRSEVNPAGNTATAARHREALEARAATAGESFRDDQQYRDARTASENLYDAGDVSGYGRSGSSFAQEAFGGRQAVEQQRIANTLQALEGFGVNGVTAQELSDARARHIGDYISKAATPTFDKRGRQTSGWTGGDSWRGGARLAGRADRNVGAYAPPSDAMLAMRIKSLRNRGAI